MTLIQRQDALVKKLVQVHMERLSRGWFGQDLQAKRSIARRLHVQELVAAGYTKKDAADSAQQCDDVACLEAAHEHFAKSFGG